MTACREVRFRGHSHRCTQLYTGIQSSTDVGFSRVGVRRIHAYLDGESPQKSPGPIASPAHNSTGKSKTHGRINSSGARRGGGVQSRGLVTPVPSCGSSETAQSIHRGRHCTPNLLLGTDARLVHRRNKMECLWVVRWVSRAKSSATPTNSPQLKPINSWSLRLAFWV